MTARSKPNYDRDLESGTKSGARSKVNYDRDPKSGMKSTPRSKSCYNKDLDKSCSDNATNNATLYGGCWARFFIVDVIPLN